MTTLKGIAIFAVVFIIASSTGIATAILLLGTCQFYMPVQGFHLGGTAWGCSPP